MRDVSGIAIIRVLRSRYILLATVSAALIAAGIAFLLAVVFHFLFTMDVWWGILFYCIAFVLLLLIRRPWQVTEPVVAAWLDQQYPQLEESAGLLLREPASLNILGRFQFEKATLALHAIESPFPVGRRILPSLLLFTGMLAAGFALLLIPTNSHQAMADKSEKLQIIAKKENILPQISNVAIAIHPPAYTAKPAREQHAFNLLAEEGAAVSWKMQTSIAAKEMVFIFNDTLRIKLHPADTAHRQWQLERKIDSTGFYQLSIDGQVSELYKIETIADKAPVITLASPQQYTTIDYGQPQQVKIGTSITDDYSVRDAFIAATIASGSGEAVKFKEQKIDLAGFSAGKMQYQLQQTLLLQKMGMQPGDELYFYIQATDNHQQQARSDIYIVHLPDTAQLMSLEGLGNSLTVKPDYFRSQRQIIIETEQLLKDRDTISAETFKNKSNNLGIDQKLLRLRYGKFLGDESSGETEGADALGDIADFSNAEKVMDAFTDHHDNSEDATYLDPETKKQLRATLNEMWKAELQLRTFTPKEALPFEYKALRLLKDLQQKSRVYVAKTNFKTTPLDNKKRLTGDLSKIAQTQLQKDIAQEPDLQEPVRMALSALEDLKTDRNNSHFPASIWQQANLRLHEKAISQPGIYLPAIESMKRIMDAVNHEVPVKPEDISIVQHGLQQLLSTPLRQPSAGKSNSHQALSKQYFENLQKRQP